jgi:hypothetical protein
MADHGEVEYATATGNDYPEHEHTYEEFVKLATVGTLLVVNIVVVLGLWGVEGHWLEAAGLFVIAIGASMLGAATGSNVPAIISLLLGLIALALN